MGFQIGKDLVPLLFLLLFPGLLRLLILQLQSQLRLPFLLFFTAVQIAGADLIGRFHHLSRIKGIIRNKPLPEPSFHPCLQLPGIRFFQKGDDDVLIFLLQVGYEQPRGKLFFRLFRKLRRLAAQKHMSLQKIDAVTGRGRSRHQAFQLSGRHRDAIKQMADKKVQDEHFLFLNLHAPVMQSVLDRLELSSLILLIILHSRKQPVHRTVFHIQGRHAQRQEKQHQKHGQQTHILIKLRDIILQRVFRHIHGKGKGQQAVAALIQHLLPDPVRRSLGFFQSEFLCPGRIPKGEENLIRQAV